MTLISCFLCLHLWSTGLRVCITTPSTRNSSLMFQKFNKLHTEISHPDNVSLWNTAVKTEKCKTCPNREHGNCVFYHIIYSKLSWKVQLRQLVRKGRNNKKEEKGGKGEVEGKRHGILYSQRRMWNHFHRTIKKVQWLRAFAALAEDPRLVSSTHTGHLTTVCNFSCRRSVVLFLPV